MVGVNNIELIPERWTFSRTFCYKYIYYFHVFPRSISYQSQNFLACQNITYPVRVLVSQDPQTIGFFSATSYGGVHSFQSL